MNNEELRKLTNATNTLKERIVLYTLVKSHGREPQYEIDLLDRVMSVVEYIGNKEWKEKDGE